MAELTTDSHHVPALADGAQPVSLDSSPLLQALCKGLGMDPTTKDVDRIPDVNFLQEMVKLPIDLSKIPAGTDYPAMRLWVDELFQNILREYISGFDVHRRHPVRRVEKSIISVQCSGSSDKFDLWIYTPATHAEDPLPLQRPVILMFHGGGWIHGSPIGDEHFAEIFASELNAVIIGVNYRWAPEHPFPAGLDDCVEALNWTIQNAAKYAIDTNRIAWWGCSAGGNLAAALAIKYSQTPSLFLRSQAKVVSLVVPVTATLEAQALYERDNPSVLEGRSVPHASEQTLKDMETLTKYYTGGAVDPCNPLLSPLMAKHDPQHYPRTHITVAGCDYLREQGEDYAHLLKSSGVPTTVDLLPGVPHGFNFPVNADLVKRWVERQIDIFEVAFQ